VGENLEKGPGGGSDPKAEEKSLTVPIAAIFMVPVGVKWKAVKKDRFGIITI
jgi:hypothetical protein